ncbi:hypothetical protein AVEN_36240-1 [Araneus ventricosus]|uniref:Uncharacterized protein n=1 Tax=Araneus ventricosus TaxID=182803 RepID=A0A4Y2JAI1_ARAVE|nr:hypothetical protein AVEN_36240-1 [Araneus ventricosus]
MEAPSQRHNRSLQPPMATVHTPPPAFKTGPAAPLSRESFTSPFCGFHSCERGSLSFNHDRISNLWPNAPRENPDRMKIQAFRPHRSNSHRILALTTGFRTTGSRWCRMCICSQAEQFAKRSQRVRGNYFHGEHTSIHRKAAINIALVSQ